MDLKLIRNSTTQQKNEMLKEKEDNQINVIDYLIKTKNKPKTKKALI